MNFLKKFPGGKYPFAAINILALIFLTPFFFSGKTTVPVSEKKHFLYMAGEVRTVTGDLPHTLVEIFTDSVTRFAVLATDTEGWIGIELPLQNTYIIKFIKRGYVTKKIKVDTHVPENFVNDYSCEFVTEMFPQIPEIDASVLERPVANFHFSEKRRNFEYDALLSAKINRQLKSSYARYYLSKRNENVAAKRNSLK